MSKVLPMIVIAVMGSACGPHIRVRSDFDPNVNLTSYKSIALKQGNSSGNPVMDRRILDDLAHALEAKGYTIAPEGQADAVAVEHAATREKHSYETFYDEPAWGGWGWRRGWRWGLGTPVVREYDFTVGTLVVDLFDTREKQAIWHGSARGLVSGDPEKDARNIQTAITKLFDRLPTRTAG